jgi:predicted HTH transcriptional regulator
MDKKRIFISSAQKEFAKERKLLCNYIRQDALLGKYFVPFIFEELPAANQSAQQTYISEVQNSDIYLGVIGVKYGFVDNDSISPTEKEFDEATKWNKYRICFVKVLGNGEKREEKEDFFVQKIEEKLIRKSFQDYETLRSSVYAALIRYLEEKEFLRLLPFDASYHPETSINEIDEKKIDTFVRIAQKARNFPLQVGTPVIDVLRHLNLVNTCNLLKNPAILLFGKYPQRFFITSEIKCAQFYGDEVTKPIPSYQGYQGDLFEMVTQAVDFVASRINVRVGTRHNSVQAPIDFELPLESIREAIVNAVAHRDYTSKGSIQVMLFRNRLEIWNPGHLPTGITIEQLYEVHESFPNNPLIANPLYLAAYAEKLGTGTADILKQCLAIGLKPPTFSQTDNFRITFWRHVEPLSENVETLEPNLESSGIDFESVTKETIKTLRANLGTMKPLQGLPKRMNKVEIEKVILMLCANEYLTINQMSKLVGRSSAYLLNEIIPPLIDSQKLIRLFPATPNHQNQAYRKNIK